MKRVAMIPVCLVLLATSVLGQGFVNLNFESAYDLPGNPGNGAVVSVTNALPGWTSSQFYIFYVSNSLGDVSGPVGLEGGSLALSGEFNVGLFQNSSISQTGLVPDDAESLEFEAYVPEQNGLGISNLSVTLGGENLSILSEGGEVYGVNIPADLDGKAEALAFSCQGPGSGNVLLDNIEFSSSVVPEPSECALIGLGVMVFGFRRRRRRI